MNNKRFILSALTVGAAMLIGCPGPAATPDSGTDGGPATPDSGPRDSGPDSGPHDGGTDGGPTAPDANVPLTCAGLCAQVTSVCTGANLQYTDMATCVSECTAAMWPVGTEADTSGNTLGCRIYHSIVAGSNGATSAMTHCPHTSLFGGGVCTPFRTDAATEVTVTGTAHPAGYLRVDRMGMPAVSTALIPAASKNAYNDGNPDLDAALTFGPAALGTLVGLHVALDSQLRGLHFTPCSILFTPFNGVPGGVPYCAAQGLDGNPAHPVAGLILPDTLRLDPTSTATFPNGRNLTDPVIDITLGVLLLSTQHTCDPDRTCQVHADATTCAADLGCQFLGGSCQNVDCESRTDALCTATPGCQRNVCGATGTAPCNAASFTALGAHGGLSQRPNDATFLTSFPYFAVPHVTP